MESFRASVALRRPAAAWDYLELRPIDYFAPLPLTKLFPTDQPLTVDLGCGEGSFLVELAKRHPEQNFLGVERQNYRVRKVCKKAWKAQLTNLRVIKIESEFFIRQMLLPGSISRLFLLFADPWPKARHHGRRVVQPSFLKAVTRVLAPEGEFLIKTDHAEYFTHIEEEIARFNGFDETRWPDNPTYPMTDFETLFVSQGLPIYSTRLTKR